MQLNIIRTVHNNLIQESKTIYNNVYDTSHVQQEMERNKTPAFRLVWRGLGSHRMTKRERSAVPVIMRLLLHQYGRKESHACNKELQQSDLYEL